MISLNTQVQIITFGIMYGFLTSIIYSFFNRLFYKKIITRFVLELPFFIFLTIIYFIVNIKINDGKINIYQPLWLLIGVLLYYKFYSKYFLPFYEMIVNYLYQKLLLPFKNKYDIIKKKLQKKVKKHGKKRKSTSNKMESKQGGKYFTTWNFPNSNHF